MLHRAYAAQCAAEESRHKGVPPRWGGRLTLFALALGSFGIGSGEFGSNGIIQLFSASLGVGIPAATYAITAYAVGVMIGSPLITLFAAGLNRRTLLLALVALFICGNLLSAASPNLDMLVVARFVTGTVQGAYFGAGAVVAAYVFGPGRSGKAFALVMMGLTIATIVGSPMATYLGQHLGWRATYLAVAGVGVLAGIALLAWVPRTDALHGGPVVRELGALRRPAVWVMMTVAALGISSIFAVYTFIGPFVTDAAALSPAVIPLGLALFGIGMTVGNLVGGRLADRSAGLTLVLGYAGALVFLVALGLFGRDVPVLMLGMFGVGATMMVAIPGIQVGLTRAAPGAPALMGAMNLAALNVANALGALGGGITIGAGFGVLSTVWVGLGLTATGLLLFAVAVPRRLRSRSELAPA
jgi:MFS transporter, DHA1 family, inner membrane transport protein